MTTTTTAPVGEHAELLGTSDLVLLGGAPLLLAAAQFAATDEGKGAICAVQLKQADGVLSLYATNGHMAFRCRIPQGGGVNWSMSSDELLLDAKPLRKQAARAVHLILKEDRVELLDSKVKPIDLRIIERDRFRCHRFPEIDKIWPSSFSYSAGASICWSARYMTTIHDIAARLSDKGNVVFRFSTGQSPLEMACTFAESIEVEFLLMPVVVRAEDRTSRDYPPQDSTAAA